MISLGLHDEAGRAAYVAAFRAAQALIFERHGKTPKTHRGVHAQFGRLAQSEPTIGVDLRRFLAQAYDLKTYADYGTTKEIGIEARAAWAIDHADQFIARVTRVIGEAP
jgi:uncharacterized protein (UPF0332 family)